MKPLLFCFLVVMLGICQVATGGGISSGGADLVELDWGSAWFAEEGGPIRVCLKTDAPGDVRRTVEHAFGTWKAYVEKKKLFDLRPREFRPGMEIAWDTACTESSELVFVVGNPQLHPPVTAVLESGRYVRPTSFAFRESYHRGRGRGRGFIWVGRFPKNSGQPDTDQPEILTSLVVHEVGHVLGLPHVDGTVMEAGIAEHLLRLSPGLRKPLEVDGALELVLSRGCNQEYRGVWFDDSHSSTFRTLTGRTPRGAVKAAVNSGYMGSFTLFLQDEIGGFSFPLARRSAGPTALAALNRSLFKVVRESSRQVPGGGFDLEFAAESQYATVEFGELTGIAGNAIAVSLERNMSMRLSLSRLEDGLPLTFFRSFEL